VEKVLMIGHETRKVINYEKIELIKPENWPALKNDLEERTGLTILRFEIGKIDFLKDTAKIVIYYFENENAGTIE